MATEDSQQSEQDDQEQNSEEVCHPPTKGSSPYARMGETLEDRIRAKEEKRLKGNQKVFPRRTGLHSRVGLKRGKGLNPVSKKQKKKLKQYKDAREKHYAMDTNRCCFLCGSNANLSIHHVEKRGNQIANENTFITLCLIGDFMDVRYPESNHSHSGGCHGWLEANKSLARELGLLK